MQPKYPIYILWCLTACDINSESEYVHHPGQLVQSVEYQTGWLDDDALQSETIVSDLGYIITLERGYIVHYAVQLVPCENDRQSKWMPSFISQAVAGHAGMDDISVTPVPVIDAIHERKTVSLGGNQFTPTRYCQLHYLIGRANESTENLPVEPTMHNVSLHLSGAWSHAESQELNPFVIETDLAYGEVFDLPDNTMGSHLKINLYRPLQALFNGVDFKQQNANAQAWQVLVNSMESIELTIAP